MIIKYLYDSDYTEFPTNVPKISEAAMETDLTLEELHNTIKEKQLKIKHQAQTGYHTQCTTNAEKETYWK